jgi:hypothetical protein
MAKRSFVQVDGELWEKQPDNSVIIRGVKHFCFAGRWEPAGSGPASFTIIPDISPYRSVITGETISGRAQHRQHLREHGCIEVGNEPVRPPERTWDATKDLRKELIARING